ncbi:type VI secretion system Vgr family protein, partial [Neisseria mucosa]
DSAHPDHIPADWNTRNVIRTWANNKLRMEDLQGQEHIKLATDYQKSQLNLGHIVDSNREKRGENGEGFELRTDGWGAVRAGKGILVSAQNQDANGKVLDMDAAIAQIEQALSLAKSLNKAAQTANNHNTDEETQRGRLKDALKELKEAGLVQTAPAGIATATQQSQLHTANENIHLVSGNHTDITAGQSLTAHAAESVNLFAQSSGIKVQANQGKVEVQAQNDELQLNALKDATLTSSAGKITIAAKEEVLITCKGAYIKLSNGEVEIGSPKVVRVRAPLVVNGANGIKHKISDFKQNYSGGYIIYDEKTGLPITNLPYELTTENNEKLKGITNMEGKTIMAFTDKPEKVKIDIQKHSSERKRTLYFAGVESMDLYLEWTENEGAQ